MSNLAKVGSVITLVIANLVFYQIREALNKKDYKGQISWSTYLIVQTFFELFLFFFLVWVLSRFFSIRLIGLFLAVVFIWLIFTAFIWALLGSPRGVWRSRYLLAFFEYQMTHSVFTLLIIGIYYIIGISYTIIAYNIIFHQTIPSLTATILAFRYTLFLIFAGLILLFPFDLAVLISQNIDENTRIRGLIGNLGFLGIKTIYLVVLFWSIGYAGMGFKITVGEFNFTISPELIIIVVAFFIIFYFLPYLAGSQRAKKWREQLLEKRLVWLGEVLDILERPTPSLYTSKLKRLQAKIDSEKKHFVEEDWMVKRGEEFDQVETLDEIDTAEHDLAQLYYKARQLDSRFMYLDYLKNLFGEISECIAEFTRSKGEAKLTSKARAYADAYRIRKNELTESLIQEEKTKPVLWVGLTVIFSPIVAQILSEFGKWIWATMLQAAGK